MDLSKLYFCYANFDIEKRYCGGKKEDCECGKVGGFNTNNMNFLFCQFFQKKNSTLCQKI
jgi:hypothetical protein